MTTEQPHRHFLLTGPDHLINAAGSNDQPIWTKNQFEIINSPQHNYNNTAVEEMIRAKIGDLCRNNPSLLFSDVLGLVDKVVPLSKMTAGSDTNNLTTATTVTNKRDIIEQYRSAKCHMSSPPNTTTLAAAAEALPALLSFTPPQSPESEECCGSGQVPHQYAAGSVSESVQRSLAEGALTQSWGAASGTTTVAGPLAASCDASLQLFLENVVKEEEKDEEEEEEEEEDKEDEAASFLPQPSDSDDVSCEDLDATPFCASPSHDPDSSPMLTSTINYGCRVGEISSGSADNNSFSYAFSSSSCPNMCCPSSIIGSPNIGSIPNITPFQQERHDSSNGLSPRVLLPPSSPSFCSMGVDLHPERYLLMQGGVVEWETYAEDTTGITPTHLSGLNDSIIFKDSDDSILNSWHSRCSSYSINSFEEANNGSLPDVVSDVVKVIGPESSDVCLTNKRSTLTVQPGLPSIYSPNSSPNNSPSRSPENNSFCMSNNKLKRACSTKKNKFTKARQRRGRTVGKFIRSIQPLTSASLADSGYFLTNDNDTKISDSQEEKPLLAEDDVNEIPYLNDLFSEYDFTMLESSTQATIPVLSEQDLNLHGITDEFAMSVAADTHFGNALDDLDDDCSTSSMSDIEDMTDDTCTSTAAATTLKQEGVWTSLKGETSEMMDDNFSVKEEPVVLEKGPLTNRSSCSMPATPPYSDDARSPRDDNNSNNNNPLGFLQNDDDEYVPPSPGHVHDDHSYCDTEKRTFTLQKIEVMPAPAVSGRSRGRGGRGRGGGRKTMPIAPAETDMGDVQIINVVPTPVPIKRPVGRPPKNGYRLPNVPAPPRGAGRGRGRGRGRGTPNVSRAASPVGPVALPPGTHRTESGLLVHIGALCSVYQDEVPLMKPSTKPCRGRPPATPRRNIVDSSPMLLGRDEGSLPPSALDPNRNTNNANGIYPNKMACYDPRPNGRGKKRGRKPVTSSRSSSSALDDSRNATVAASVAAALAHATLDAAMASAPPPGKRRRTNASNMDPAKREEHNRNERSRRSDIRAAFEELRYRLPLDENGQTPKLAKVRILSYSRKYCESLKLVEQLCVNEKEALKHLQRTRTRHIKEMLKSMGRTR